jgi:MFS family permease
VLSRAQVEPLLWLVLRAIVGFGCAGLFVTTESWLNAKAQPAQRGRVFALYMVGTFIALAIGQLLIGRVPIKTMVPFNIIIALFAVALVMVCATRAEPPRPVAAAILPYGRLARTAPVAVVGATLSGLAVLASSRSLLFASPPHLERSFEVLAGSLAHDPLGSSNKLTPA